MIARPGVYSTTYGTGSTLDEVVVKYLRHYGCSGDYQVVAERVGRNGEHIIGAYVPGRGAFDIIVWGG